MKGTPEVITVLNEVLMERHAYFIQLLVCSVMCGKWGYCEQAELFDFLSEEDFEVFSKLIARISFLDGMSIADKLQEFKEDVTTVDEMLLFAKNSRLLNIFSLSRVIEVCTNFKDYGTRNLIEKMLVEEDEHLAKVEAAIIQFGERGK